MLENTRAKEEKVSQGITDLVAELEHIFQEIEDHGLLDSAKEELEGQSGSIATILEDWNA